MPQLPNRLSPDTEYDKTLALANDNFDKTVQDISDLGARFSSVGSASFTVAAGAIQNINVDVSDDRPQYRTGFLQIVPRVEIRVDVDDDDHVFAYGSALTSPQMGAVVSCYVQRRSAVGKAAKFLVQVYNFDTNPHTYFLTVDESYINSPSTSNFR